MNSYNCMYKYTYICMYYSYNYIYQYPYISMYNPNISTYKYSCKMYVYRNTIKVNRLCKYSYNCKYTIV